MGTSGQVPRHEVAHALLLPQPFLLCRYNDVARLCVLLWMQSSLKNMFQSLISQIYSDENIPTVTVEMALSRRYSLAVILRYEPLMQSSFVPSGSRAHRSVA